jgi:hypothetical protein
LEKSDIIIDPEFAHKIPPLTDDEFRQLEENIVADGEVYEPIVTWNGVIVDGHNRWKIIQKHPEIPYKTREMDFPDKWAAFDWMYKKQLGRRNLTENQRTILIGKMYEARKQSHGGQIPGSSQTGNTIPSRVSEQIADELGVGKNTVIRAEKFAKGFERIREVDSVAAEKVLTGEANITKTAVQELSKAEPETVKAATEKIKAGEAVEVETIKSLRGYKEPLAQRTSTLDGTAQKMDTEFADVLEDLNLTADTFLRQFEKTLRENRKIVKSNLAEVVSVMERVKKTLEKIERKF